MLRRFHKLLCDTLGVMKPDDTVNDETNQLSDDSLLDSAAYSSRLNYYSVTHAPDNLSLVSFGQNCYPPDELQTALVRLPMVPPDMGNPEEGSGVPPRILTFMWDLLARRGSATAEQPSGQADVNAGDSKTIRGKSAGTAVAHPGGSEFLSIPSLANSF